MNLNHLRLLRRRSHACPLDPALGPPPRMSPPLCSSLQNSVRFVAVRQASDGEVVVVVMVVVVKLELVSDVGVVVGVVVEVVVGIVDTFNGLCRGPEQGR